MERVIEILRWRSPLGHMLLGAVDGRLCLADWEDSPGREQTVRRLCRAFNARLSPGSTEVAIEAATQLEQYFDGLRVEFTVPLAMSGTPFQTAVWQELLRIPYGTTVTYGEQAARLGRPAAVRAVAQANGANPLCIFVPCHRVTASRGALGGYTPGAHLKRALLHLEGVTLPQPAAPRRQCIMHNA